MNEAQLMRPVRSQLHSHPTRDYWFDGIYVIVPTTCEECDERRYNAAVAFGRNVSYLSDLRPPSSGGHHGSP